MIERHVYYLEKRMQEMIDYINRLEDRVTDLERKQRDDNRYPEIPYWKNPTGKNIEYR